MFRKTRVCTGLMIAFGGSILLSSAPALADQTLERVEQVTRLGLRSVVTSWAGLRTFVRDRRPVVGALPGHPGFWFVAGQGGSGIETAPALSSLAATVITGTAPPPDVLVDPADFAPSRPTQAT